MHRDCSVALPKRNRDDTEVALGLDRDGTHSDGAKVSPRWRRDGHSDGTETAPSWYRDGTEKTEMALDGVEMASRWHLSRRPARRYVRQLGSDLAVCIDPDVAAAGQACLP